MKDFKFDTKTMVLLGLLTAVVAVFSFTPIGSIPVGPLVITLNIIPIAIAAVALGPIGGAIIGAVFGIFSFLQCFGIVGFSGMGAVLVGISPVLCFIQRFVSRMLVGVLCGLVYKALEKRTNVYVSCMITGFSAAFFNTLFFMSSLVLLFGHTEYIQGLMAGRGVIAFIIASVGINAVVEMIVAAVVTGAVGAALKKARLI